MSSIAPPSYNSPLGEGTVRPSRPIGSLLRRIGAFIIDGILLGIAGTLIALPFFDVFSRLGAWGALVGFCIALPYFAILESRIGGGKTLGKRLVRLQVVDASGNPVSFPKSVLRYSLFAIPYFLNELPLPITRTPWIVSALLTFLIFGLGGVTFYLVCFNRRTRQGVHDLAAGTYVTDAEQTGSVQVQAIWKMHWVIVGSALVILFSFAGILAKKAVKWGPIPQMLQDATAIEAMPGVQQAGVQDLTSWGATKRKSYVFNIRWAGKSADEEAFANTVASLILRTDPTVQGYDDLRIVMIRGYDLGIAHAQVTRSFTDSPANWSTRLSRVSPSAGSSPLKL